MKKICLLAALLMSVNVAEARWYDNFNIFGSNDSQHKRRGVAQTQTQNPVSVPEPASIILLSLGVGALALIKRFKK